MCVGGGGGGGSVYMCVVTLCWSIQYVVYVYALVFNSGVGVCACVCPRVCMW